jgi:hypothetical protein
MGANRRGGGRCRIYVLCRQVLLLLVICFLLKGARILELSVIRFRGGRYVGSFYKIAAPKLARKSAPTGEREGTGEVLEKSEAVAGRSAQPALELDLPVSPPFAPTGLGRSSGHLVWRCSAWQSPASGFPNPALEIEPACLPGR